MHKLLRRNDEYRFDEYNNKTSVLIDYYSKQGKFHSVDGLGNINEITERISNLINSNL